MSLDDPATAEGDFLRTPLPHLLVYMADRRLTGALFLCEPDGTEHIVRFEEGAPAKVFSGDRYALFGELLIEAGVVEEQVVREALATKGLLGDVLILTGHAVPETLERIAAVQHERRVVRLFGLPSETSYRYFDGDPALAEDAGRVHCRDVLHLIMAGLRSHPRSGMSLSRLLEKLGEARLRLHPDAALERFGFTDEEACVASAVLMDRPTFVDLLSTGVAESSVVRRVVYALLLTRQLDSGARQLEGGQKVLPLGAGDVAPAIAVGRVALVPAIHRSGAAAPDPAGDGERAAVMPRTLRRRKQATEPQQPGVGHDGEEEPVSDVVEIGGPYGERARDTGTAGSGSSSV
jgi:hypothetical protein